MDILIERKRRRDVPANLTVGQKLAVGFGLVGLVSVALVLVTFVAISRLDTANVAEERAVGKVNAATEVQHWAAVMRAEQLTYVSSEDITRSVYESAVGSFEIALDNLRGTAASPTELALITKISTGYQTFLATDQFIWQALLDGNQSAANNYVLGAAALNFGFMAADADLFEAEAVREQQQTEISFAETRDQTRVIVAALGVLAIVLVAVASRAIASIIRDPLLDLQLGAVQAATGNLEAEVPVRGSDEIGTLGVAFNSMLVQLRTREARMLEEHDRAELSRQIDVSLEMAETEEDVYEFVSRALEEIAPDRSAELLLADNSRAHFTQVAVAGPVPEGPGCQVSTPNSCPAVRAAAKMIFDNSDSLDSCLKLNGRASGPCSATCVPVSFMGRSVGVLHSTGPAGQHVSDDVAFALETLARAAGGRIGVIRS
ncbi:MAG: HAMP domain-containing protein, partial [Acidimicrobiales bacterium]